MQTSDRPKTATTPPGAGDNTPPVTARPSTQPVPLLLLKAMRPQQWTKNVLLFAGLVFSCNLLEWNLIVKAFYGFVLFCVFSSCVYLINDLRDRERDRLNPRTAKRPIASGALDPRVALGAVIVMLPLAFIF